MGDDIWGFLGNLADALAEQAALDRVAKQERRNSPEARAARSARSQKAAATRRRNREAAEQLQAERDEREPTGPTCNAFGIILQAQEVHCVLPPRTEYPHDDHEDINGNRWPYDPSEDED